MVHGRADDRQPERDVDRVVEAGELRRDMALVVVHGNHGVEVARGGAQEDGVRRDRARDVPALGAQLLDGRLDQLGLLGAEQAVLAGVRIQARDGDVRLVPDDVARGLARQPRGGHDALGGDQLDGAPERDVRRDVHHAQPVRGQHHRHVLVGHACEARQQLGMADADPARFAERLLVERRGDDRADLVVERQLRRALEVLVGGLARLPGTPGPPELLDVDVGQVEQVDRAGVVAGLGRRRSTERTSSGPPMMRTAASMARRSPITSGRDVVVHVGVGQRLGDDLGPDAARIAHGDRQDRPARLSSCSVSW